MIVGCGQFGKCVKQRTMGMFNYKLTEGLQMFFFARRMFGIALSRVEHICLIP